MNSLKPSLTTQEHQAISEQFVEPMTASDCVYCGCEIPSNRQCKSEPEESCGREECEGSK